MGWEGDLQVSTADSIKRLMANAHAPIEPLGNLGNIYITVTEFLEVRQYVAARLRDASPQSKSDTRIRQAEHLMGAGIIDVQAVIAKLHPAVEDDPPAEENE